MLRKVICFQKLKKSRRYLLAYSSLIIISTLLLYTTQHSGLKFAGCNQLTCHRDAICYDLLEKYICKCNSGFYGDGTHCFDVDECKQEAAAKCGEKQFCVNTIGSYHCVCNTGYHSIGNSICEDINECKVKNPCDDKAICKNTLGSYECVCPSGHVLKGGLCKKLISAKSSQALRSSELKADPKVKSMAQMKSKQENVACRIPKDDGFPNCKAKVKWLEKYWKSDVCYNENGVDGSLCSFIWYLSEVEMECPLLPGRRRKKTDDDESDAAPPSMIPPPKARINHLDKLEFFTDVLKEHENFKWMRKRISSMWSDWLISYERFAKKQKSENRRQKRILVYMGSIVKKGWNWSKSAFKGGPLGELVQWSDLIVSLYSLGHNVTIPSTEADLPHAKNIGKAKSPCRKTKWLLDGFDLIYTDVHGMSMLKKRGLLTKIKCRLRVVDTFGTEARFNFAQDIDESEVSVYGSKELASLLKNDPYSYGHWELDLKQFMTMFPHSPDNSFLGFAVSREIEDAGIDMNAKNDSGLVYGKNKYMWKEHTQYLSVVHKMLSLVGTVAKNEKDKWKLPGFVNNIGLQNWEDYQKLLAENKIFVGLGFPFEGPGPLEAIAKGCVFLNPKYTPPLNRLQDMKFDGKKFFDGKPTLRKISSQHPYMEEFVGKPYVYTINMNDQEEVTSTVQEILQKFKEKKIKPYLPFEFTHEGLLERFNVYIENQNFCNSNSSWPGKDALVTVTSKPNESCKNACRLKGLVCDNGMFKYVNTKSELEKEGCKSFNSKRSLLAPYINVNEKSCVLQDEHLLFSCVDAAPLYKRICPCRDFIKGQVALCKTCV